MPDRKTELILGAVLLLLGLLAGAVWVPLDSETPPIYEFRRQTYIGDALLPMLAALGIALCAAVHVAITLLERGTSDRGGPAFDRHAALFLLSVFALMALSGLVMFWSGPLALALFGPETDPPATYRLMRGTAPWKYLGFTLGGTLLVFGLISLLEGRMRAGRLLIAVLAVAALIAVFDLPFDTLLLPPNGDF
ncbi:hypothetical protein [Mameliella alba]|uniref:Tripartite tricarboxylate transporter TctB family protein n=1 Tax=Mameliella alba TaxID=561184 RepID=A0A0B3RIR1_9RHOB|nr:hypothetical protein [Mameliella alba]KHQ51155.1 hypothetical protein OA50_04186 [Mameliella alba]